MDKLASETWFVLCNAMDYNESREHSYRTPHSLLKAFSRKMREQYSGFSRYVNCLLSNHIRMLYLPTKSEYRNLVCRKNIIYFSIIVHGVIHLNDTKIWPLPNKWCRCAKPGTYCLFHHWISNLNLFRRILKLTSKLLKQFIKSKSVSSRKKVWLFITK